MPSPLGHALAGASIAWLADAVPGNTARGPAAPAASAYERAGGRLTVACIALATAPDLDLAFTSHRTYTHSVGAVAFVFLFAAAMAAKARLPILRVALLCACAYGSHILLDWLGADSFAPRGIQALWPFTNGWYISDLDVFRQTARRQLTTGPILRRNLLAGLQELAIMVPVAWVAWRLRASRESRRRR